MALLQYSVIEEIENEAVSLRVSEIARYLQDHLGQKLTAYLSGLKDPKMVGRWIAGGDTRLEAKMRLREGYKAARILEESYHDDEMTISWFTGSNTRLDDRAPARVLRYGETPESIEFVVPVARAFAGVAD